ncbi:MAG: M3 family metallopeptidase [Succinivibrio sp.]|nr:M3 family metallopeptidase [Succinivibrio sp.]
MSKSQNPLLNFEWLPDFAQVKPEHLKPAVKKSLQDCKKLIVELCAKYQENPTWNTVMLPIEEADDKFTKTWSVISHLNSVLQTPAYREAYDACLPMVSKFSAWAGQYRPFFEVVSKIRQSEDFAELTVAQQQTIEHSLRDFKLSGVDLPEEQQKIYVNLSTKLSLLESQFANNVLDATHAYTLVVEKEEDLKGLPSGVIRLAKSEAQKRQLEGWVFTLDMPSYLPFLTYADNRQLREQIYTAYNTRASELGPDGGKWDNQPLMEQILKLRYELAKLLGFKSYAHLSLATKMAKEPEEVLDFLNDLARKSHPQGEREVAELRKFAREQGLDELKPWDVAYYSEKLRKKLYDYDAEELRAYFPVDTVTNGIFECAHRLYGISFKLLPDFKAWHELVRVYGIYAENGSRIGTLLIDLYAREGKRGGAWMDECLTRRLRQDGALQLPVTYLCCNFTRPLGNAQSELTHDEVETFFHEFGHALNHLLTKVDVADVSGINGVCWDVVELPSQFNENYAWQEECLNFLSRNTHTGQPLPKEKLEALLKAKNFHSAMAMLRQLEFALFDFRVHLEYDPSKGARIYEILEQVRDQVTVVPRFPLSRFPNSFTHIFAGGYAAGYYSYKWAEVLAADAFSRFKEEGIFNRQVGADFERYILSVGGASDPMENFVAFRGRKPSVDALLSQSGISLE